MEYKIAIPSQLSVLVLSRRKSEKLNQTELGERLGLSQRSVSQFEAKAEAASFSRVWKILNALGMELVIRERAAREPLDGDQY